MRWRALVVVLNLGCQIELNPNFIEPEDGTAGGTADTTADTTGSADGTPDTTTTAAESSADHGGTDTTTSSDDGALDASTSAAETEEGTTTTASDTGVTMEHRVFITSMAYDGALGGIAAADTECGVRASMGGLSGTFVALLSAVGDAAGDRIAINGPVRTLDGSLVANDADDLWDGTILHEIDLNELGETQGNENVWTGTLTDGNAASTDCDGWTVGNGQASGTRGLGSMIDSGGWINFGAAACGQGASLYCIEQ